MSRGIHLRYLGDDVRVVKGVGVFQKGTVAFAPRDVAVHLISSGNFEAVAGGPTAQAFVVRIGPDTIPGAEVAPARVAPEEPADFERALEEEERRLAAMPPDVDPT